MKESKQKTFRPLRKFLNTFKLLHLLLMIYYFVYSINHNHGNMIANITFLCVYCVYFVFLIINFSNKYKNVGKVFKRGFARAKLLIRLFVIASLIYSIIIAADKSILTIILAYISLSMWLMSLFFEIMISLFNKIKFKRNED